MNSTYQAQLVTPLPTMTVPRIMVLHDGLSQKQEVIHQSSAGTFYSAGNQARPRKQST